MIVPFSYQHGKCVGRTCAWSLVQFSQSSSSKVNLETTFEGQGMY